MDRVARFHSNLFFAFAVLLVAAGAAIGFQLSGSAAVLILGIIVLALGLPHGALDLFIARNQGFWSGWRSFLGFHAVYLAIAGLTELLFQVVPALALGLFLLASVWHFSDDWPGLPRPIRFGAASVIVLGPILADPAGVAQIFYAVIGLDEQPPTSVPYPFLLVSSWLLVACIGLAFVQDRRSGIELAALGVLAAVLPALVFFTAYFTLLHSPRHLLAHRHLVSEGSAKLTALLYTGLATSIVGVLVVVLPGEALVFSEEIMRGLFVGLAALTFPHMILLEFKSRREKIKETQSHATRARSDVLDSL